jgi:hypothetical protein
LSTRQEANKFIITREDRAVDPVTLLSEGLAIGRLPDCELNLNHPTVSRLHAGIRKVDDRFYIFHLSPSNSTTLNGSLVEEKAALADGDIVQVGPFFLFIDYKGDALAVRVRYQTAVRVGDTEVASERISSSTADAQGNPLTDATVPMGADALDVFWEKRKRDAGKIMRPSPLRPRPPAPKLGKARFNWKPTRDLVRPWPFSIFTWALVVGTLLSVVAAFSYSSAFSPAPLSNAHARSTMSLTPAIARTANANSCTSCHSMRTTMEQNCASCHQTEAFTATVTPPHLAAGVGCVSCHTEHRGADFRPGVAPFNASFQAGVATDRTCAGCHNDNNQKLYNGRAVHTPHGGTFGYPVVNGQWKWKGLEEDEWQQKPEAVRKVMANWPNATDNERRSAQFHALHIYRVRTTGNIGGNASGELSCSSCHKSYGATLDRETPRTTCAACHNGRTDTQTGRVLLSADTPNCTSCHVQHVRDKRHWNPSLLAANEK